MSEKILVLLIGLLGGISVGIQSPIAGALGQRPEGIASSVMVRLANPNPVGTASLDNLMIFHQVVFIYS